MATTSYFWTSYPPFTANIVAVGDQTQAAIVGHAAGGGYLVAWKQQSSSLAPTAGRLVAADGFLSPDLIDFGSYKHDISLAARPDGSYVAAYEDRENDPGGDIRFSILNAAGTPVVSHHLVDPLNAASDDREADVAVLADGGFVVTWTRELGGGNTDIHAQVFNADGSARSAVTPVNTSTRSTTHASVTGLAGGGFVVAWQEAATAGGSTETRLRLFGADGTPLNGSDQAGVLIDAFGTINADIQVLALPDGGFVVAYADNGWSGASTDITARIYNADGTPRSGFLHVNSPALGGVTAGNQDKPTLALLADDHFVVGWSNGNHFYVQAYDVAGNAAGSNDVRNQLALEGEIAGLGAGRIAAVFESLQWDGDGTSIRSGMHGLTRITTGNGTSEIIHGIDSMLPETLIGLDGNDWLEGGAGPDALLGGPGSDYAVYAGADAGVVASLADPAVNTGDAAGDTYLSIENLLGSPFGDRLSGNAGDNTLSGALGDDILHGGAGDDILDGGGGYDTAQYAFGLGQHTIRDFGSVIMVSGASGNDRLTFIEHFEFADAKLAVADDGNALFDALYYYSGNTDVFFAGANALDHFTTNGWHEGRDPNAFFDTSGYLAINTDVAAAGINPLDHYHQTGWKEARDPSADFDTTLYLLRNPDVAAAGVDPLEHFLRFGFSEGRSAYAAIGQNIVSGFDAQYYLFHNPDVAAAGADPLQHFNAHGWHEGRNPNAWFDTAGYLAHYADIAAAGVNPLDHYMAFGWKEGRDPSAGFDTLGYLAANADVAAAGVNPLGHYLSFGIYEGRAAVNDGLWHA